MIASESLSRPASPNGSVRAGDTRWDLVERLSSSTTFQKAYRLRDFFLHVAHCALENRPEEATEQQIGIHVFGRVPGYNPNEDNIVRSQARFLRLKLEHYFASEGKGEPLIITIPKGQYLPVFEARVTPPSPVPVQSPAQQPMEFKEPRRALIHILAAAAFLFFGTTLWMGTLWFHSGPASPARLPASFVEFWDTLLGGNSTTLVVAGDHNYGLLQEAARRDVPLSSYLGRDYSRDAERILHDSGLGRILPGFSTLNLTGFHSVADVFRLTDVDQFRKSRPSVRFARDLNLGDIHSGSLILIGSRHTNPWAELFDRELNFAWGYDYGRMVNYCTNRSPRAGEEHLYYPSKTSPEQVTYGGVAFVRGGTGKHTLMIAGTSMAGEEMAGEFITNPEVCGKFLDRVKRGQSFEVLLRADGRQAEPQIVAWRAGGGAAGH